MKNILTIGLKELKSYFISPIAYVVFVMFLVLAGYFFSVILFVTKQASMQGIAYNIVITLLFLTPLITMRLFSEEKKQGTMELLMTKPVKDFEVVLGKFFAALALFISMLLSTLVYVAILSKYGNPDMGPISSTYLGIFLVGASFIALGVFASTVTENQIISAAIGFALVLLLWILSWMGSSLSENGSAILNYIALSAHLDDFVKGVINLKDVVYYLCFILFWLFVSIKSVEVRKWR